MNSPAMPDLPISPLGYLGLGILALLVLAFNLFAARDRSKAREDDEFDGRLGF